MSAGEPETGQDAVELAELAGALAARPAPRPHRTVRYGPGPAQVIDVYGAGAPRVALLHGGFWREAHDRAYLVPFAVALAGLGVPVALLEYRRAGGGGGWPATFDDVAAGLAALPGTGPVVLAGHSAGGQLALWAAVSAPARIARTVGVAAVGGLGRAAELGLGRGAVGDFLGDRLGELLPVTDPLLLPRPAAPVLLVHGAADRQVPPELSDAYAARHGARLERLPGVGHYGMFVPGTGAAGWLLAELKLAVSRA
ncbi:alpha/beta fold hydrolase [Streptomyces litchfieldiae]|uniref:Alpha/beta hydrolase n=1 Tax=Streptomyces litchfieldiae TaxID=3075543 RepID=A0ABU2MUN0_9ACTN|nr:alpha/beta hydrolase [Streptomyces sp. DSM 44938]MDT0345013.1 alpha/beta hydrolase [Streptomyces sp. DSM 44938]